MNWLRTLFSGRPHFVVGSPDNPYLLRWYLFPRNRFFNVYLHKFLRDDDDRALHDHPWHSLSILLRGRYREVTPDGIRDFSAGSIIERSAEYKHRVLVSPFFGKPAWTLFITGPKVRVWGFWCDRGFVPWHQFVDRENPGEIGPGCGESDR